MFADACSRRIREWWADKHAPPAELAEDLSFCECLRVVSTSMEEPRVSQSVVHILDANEQRRSSSEESFCGISPAAAFIFARAPIFSKVDAIEGWRGEIEECLSGLFFFSFSK